MSFKRSAEVRTELVERPRKKIRTFTEEDAKLAKIYENLASHEEDERIAAAADLIAISRGLYENGEHDHIHPERTTAAATAEKIETRLLRGLCSSRKGARLGFSLALAEVLRLRLGRHPGDHVALLKAVKEFLQHVDTATRPEHGSSSQDKRSFVLGKIFAISSLIQSQVLFERKGDVEVSKIVFDLLCTMIQEADTPWIAEECSYVCCQLVRALAIQQPDSKAAKEFLEIINERGLSKTRDGLALWLEISSAFPSVVVPRKVWGSDDPLSKKELPNLGKILHGIKEEAAAKDLSGAKQHKPHYAWTLVLRELNLRDQKAVKSGASAVKIDKLFSRFWLETVDNVYFAPTSSIEKKALGFQLFADILSFATPEAVIAAFSPKLMHCLINQSAQSDRYLHAAARTLLESIVHTTQTRPVIAPTILLSLTSGHGVVDFDIRTKSQTVFDILTRAGCNAMEAMLENFHKMILNPQPTKQTSTELIRQKIADQLVALVKHKSQPDTDTGAALITHPFEVYSKICKLFTQLGFTDQAAIGAGLEMQNKVSPGTQEMFRSRLLICLTHLTSKYPKQFAEVLDFVLAELNRQDTAEDDDELTPIITLVVFSRDDRAKVRASHEAYKKLIKHENASINQNKDKTELRSGYATLFSLALFEVYTGHKPAVEDIQKLEELTETLPLVDQEIIDMILAYYTHESALSRQLAEQSFKQLVGFVTPEGLSALIDVLKTNEGLAGAHQLFEASSDDEDEEEEEAEEDGEEAEEDGEETDDSEEDNDGENEKMVNSKERSVAMNRHAIEQDSDVKDLDIEASSPEDDNDQNEDSDTDSVSSHESTSSSSSSSSPSSSSTSSELAEFEKKLATALKVTRPPTAGTDTNNDAKNNPSSDSDSSDESMMNDDQMLALDTSISAIFQQQQRHKSGGSKGTATTTGNNNSNTKQTHRAAKQNVLAFKNRVISLLTLYLKHNYSNFTALNVIAPLHDLIRTTRNAQLAARASALLLSTYFSLAKKKGLPLSKTEDEDMDAVLKMLEDVMRSTKEWVSREHVRVGSRACLFLARVALGIATKKDEMTRGKKDEQKNGKKGKEKEKLAEKDKGRKYVVKRLDKLYEKNGKEKDDMEKMPDWQRLLWRDWDEFRRQVIEVKEVAGQMRRQ